MKSTFTYHVFAQGIIYIMLIGQLWVNVATYCHWIVNDEVELIELYSSNDSESEDETEKDEKEEKIRTDRFTPDFFLLIHNHNSFLHVANTSTHQVEVTTPPPEQNLNIV